MNMAIRRFIPQSLDIIVTPTVSLLITGIVTYVVFMPLGGFISDAITSGLLSILDVQDGQKAGCNGIRNESA